MARHNRNHMQPMSQRPAHQQVSTRPVAAEEAPADISRVPSAATAAQSAADANDADPDRYQAAPGVTDTDPVSVDEPTDIVTAEDDQGPDPVDDAEFAGFEDINTRPKSVGSVKEERLVQAPVVINRTTAEEQEYQAELVPIIPRKTQQRNFINNTNYALVKGQEQFVPRSVADHFRDKGLI